MRNKIKIVSFFSVRSYAYAIHCCKAHAKINWEIENSTPCKIITPVNLNLKVGTRDYILDITHCATFGSKLFNGAFPQVMNFCDFYRA